MPPIYDAQSIQAQVMDMDKMLLRVMTHVTRMAGGQTSQILRDLTQISSTINNLKHGVTGYVEAQQRQVGALVGVGSVINSSMGLKLVLEKVMDTLIALMNAER